MKQICILLTKYSDWISSLVYYIGGQGYTHSSIALGDQPTQFYSFNYRGFAVETTEKHRRRGVRYSRLYRLNVSDTVYERIEERIRHFLENREKYRYTRLDSIVLEESLFLFSVCGRTLIRVERAAAVPQAVLLPAQPFYTPVGNTALPCRNGTGFHLK